MKNLDELAAVIKDTMTLEQKDLVELALKVSEETGELAQAVLSYKKIPGSAYKNKTLSDVVEEGGDVLITTIATIFRANPGLTPQDVANAIEKKIERWHTRLKLAQLANEFRTEKER
jgi:NTP pyrophosphatase (non-canonical NTP hydrolase)